MGSGSDCHAFDFLSAGNGGRNKVTTSALISLLDWSYTFVFQSPVPIAFVRCCCCCCFLKDCHFRAVLSFLVFLLRRPLRAEGAVGKGLRACRAQKVSVRFASGGESDFVCVCCRPADTDTNETPLTNDHPSIGAAGCFVVLGGMFAVVVDDGCWRCCWALIKKVDNNCHTTTGGQSTQRAASRKRHHLHSHVKSVWVCALGMKVGRTLGRCATVYRAFPCPHSTPSPPPRSVFFFSKKRCEFHTPV